MSFANSPKRTSEPSRRTDVPRFIRRMWSTLGGTHSIGTVRCERLRRSHNTGAFAHLYTGAPPCLHGRGAMSTHRPEPTPPAVPTPTTAPHPRARPIPRKVRDAIEAMQSGKAKNLAQAAKCAGVSRQYLSQTLSKRPDVVQWATNRMARILGIGASVAGAQMLELTHSSSSRVSFEASRHLLVLAGIAPAN